MLLTNTERITILMIRGYDNKMRSHQNVANKVYETKPMTIKELRARILDVSNSIGQEMLENTAKYLHSVDTLSSSKRTTI